MIGRALLQREEGCVVIQQDIAAGEVGCVTIGSGGLQQGVAVS